MDTGSKRITSIHERLALQPSKSLEEANIPEWMIKRKNTLIKKDLLGKKLKFDHITKWYMHKPESVLENETHKILQNFDL